MLLFSQMDRPKLASQTWRPDLVCYHLELLKIGHQNSMCNGSSYLHPPFSDRPYWKSILDAYYKIKNYHSETSVLILVCLPALAANNVFLCRNSGSVTTFFLPPCLTNACWRRIHRARMKSCEALNWPNITWNQQTWQFSIVFPCFPPLGVDESGIVQDFKGSV